AAFLPKEYKTEDDDPNDDNKMILASATDDFVLCQDLCVMCGSFGKGEEGRLIACAQCGQCYHSYCASIKVSNQILDKISVLRKLVDPCSRNTVTQKLE
ncbi:Histone-lysine N-methyltransferase 2C, partial [Araneus ventricosus]